MLYSRYINIFGNEPRTGGRPQMKIKISNYIAGQLVEEGISQAFMVTGGGAMHLERWAGASRGASLYL